MYLVTISKALILNYHKFSNKCSKRKPWKTELSRINKSWHLSMTNRYLNYTGYGVLSCNKLKLVSWLLYVQRGPSMMSCTIHTLFIILVDTSPFYCTKGDVSTKMIKGYVSIKMSLTVYTVLTHFSTPSTFEWKNKIFLNFESEFNLLKIRIQEQNMILLK